ncbi:MAG: tol-pal system protein YbgF [Deltaproteobacteria bacterium]|jgi:tol-pal system protein YbgF|nr:tol-pal system protein YbgF [Deltaproteobacteria bacterium]
MAGRFLALAVFLAVFAGGCAAVSEDRVAKLESVVGDLQAQEIRIAMLEDRVSALLGGPAKNGADDAGTTPDRQGGREIAYTPRRISAEASPAPTQPAVPQPTAAQPAAKPAGPGGSAQAEKQYQTALTQLESGKPEAALAAFKAFLQAYPGHVLAPNAGYWLGECHYSLKEYDSAIFAFKDVVAQYPAHDKAAAAMLKAGYSYAQLGDAANARFYFEILLKDYPASQPAALARARLAAL